MKHLGEHVGDLELGGGLNEKNRLGDDLITHQSSQTQITAKIWNVCVCARVCLSQTRTEFLSVVDARILIYQFSDPDQDPGS